MLLESFFQVFAMTFVIIIGHFAFFSRSCRTYNFCFIPEYCWGRELNRESVILFRSLSFNRFLKKESRTSLKDFESAALVASTGIEPVSGASETLILSIVLRGQAMWQLANAQQSVSHFIVSARVHCMQRSLPRWRAKLHQKICG
jgi:hypothetical protein